MDKTGRSYEKLAQRVFQAILDQTTVHTIEVRHDVLLAGRTTTHQIDVYWQFEVAGRTHKMVIQCKDWKNPVKKSEVYVLTGVLDDLPGRPQGAIVAASGFQAGARKVAEEKDVFLYEMRAPTDADWEGRIREIHTTMIFLVPRMRDFTPEVDREWVLEEKRRLELPDDWQLTVEIPGIPAEDLVFQDEKGGPLMTAADATVAMFPADPEKLEERSARFVFPEPAYLETGDERFPRVRIESVSAKISRSRIEEQMITDFGSIPVLIVRDVIAGSIKHWLDKDFRILGT